LDTCHPKHKNRHGKSAKNLVYDRDREKLAEDVART